MQRRRADDPDLGYTIDQQGDQACPYRYAAHEILGSVDRVDDPLPPGQSGCPTEFLAEDAVVRTDPGKSLPQACFDRMIGVANRRQVRFGLDLQVNCPEPVQRHRVRLIGQSQRHRKVVDHLAPFTKNRHVYVCQPTRSGIAPGR